VSGSTRAGACIHGCTNPGTDIPSSDRAGCDLATVIAGEVSSRPSYLSPTRLLDRQGWTTFLDGALLLLVSFITNYCDDNLLQFVSVDAMNMPTPCSKAVFLYARLGPGTSSIRLWEALR
jgi:hypothetical protein